MKIFFDGPPIALSRPRFSRYGVYDRQKDEKRRCVWQLKLQEVTCILTGPISVHMHFYMPIPESYSYKKKKELEKKYHIGKKDLDNMIKFYNDVLNGHAYADDKQIVEIYAIKLYDTKPRTEIQIWPLPKSQ